MSNPIHNEFAKNGFIIEEGLFSSEEVQELKEEVLRVLKEKKLEKGIGAEDIEHGVYVGMARASSLFKKTAANPKLTTLLKKIIGEQVVFLGDKVVFKTSKIAFESPWHQDYSYWGGSHKYSVWIALDDATLDNGCLRVFPGSHMKGLLKHREGISDGQGFTNRMNEEDIDPLQIVDLPAERGTAIIFHDLLFHASYPNRSGKDRMALISTYKNGNDDDPNFTWANGAFLI